MIAQDPPSIRKKSSSLTMKKRSHDDSSVQENDDSQNNNRRNGNIRGNSKKQRFEHISNITNHLPTIWSKVYKPVVIYILMRFYFCNFETYWQDAYYLLRQPPNIIVHAIKVL